MNDLSDAEWHILAESSLDRAEIDRLISWRHDLDLEGYGDNPLVTRDLLARRRPALAARSKPSIAKRLGIIPRKRMEG